jgi:putative protein-disulfide isomerase
MEDHWIYDEKDALIYVGDTMCSWCHGMSPELDKLKNNHPELEFKVINGGLRPHGTEKNSEMADFLRSHWVEIEERTGQPFKYDILDNPDFVYDTEPSARAVVTARLMDESMEYEFFKAVQMAFYAENKDTNKTETFVAVATKMGLDAIKFKELFEADNTKYLTTEDFGLSQQMGIKGFPSIILKKKGKFTLIANGYKEAEKIEETILEVEQSL